MAMNGFSPDEQVERLYTQARKDADRLRSDTADRAELARIAEETGEDPFDWFKSTYSASETACVEVAFAGPGPGAWIRDSVNTRGDRLGVAAEEWRAFVRASLS